MNYNNRFTDGEMKIKKFESEDDMLEFINQNLSIITIVQVYTTIPKVKGEGWRNKHNYHLMYKLELKEKVMI